MFVQILSVLAVLSASVSAVLYTADPSHQKYMWETFKTEYHKQYDTTEDAHRFAIFIEKLKIADQRTENEKKNGGSAIHGRAY